METVFSNKSGATLGEQIPDANATPSQLAQADELADAVRDAIQTLPDEQRIATLLYEYDDAAYAEIAAVLGCSVKAVESKLSRARQTLRGKLIRWL